jgi:hypothetical protein
MLSPDHEELCRLAALAKGRKPEAKKSRARLAVLLHQIRSDRLFLRWGYHSMKAYALETLGIQEKHLEKLLVAGRRGGEELATDGGREGFTVSALARRRDSPLDDLGKSLESATARLESGAFRTDAETLRWLTLAARRLADVARALLDAEESKRSLKEKADGIEKNLRRGLR